MRALRHVILAQRPLAALLLAAALLMKLAIPAGYMPSVAGGGIAIVLCPGAAPVPTAAMPGMSHHKPDSRDHGKAESPCAFAGLSVPSMAGADPIQLALALLAIFAAALVVAPPAPMRRPRHLRPPLRGPPLPA